MREDTEFRLLGTYIFAYIFFLHIHSSSLFAPSAWNSC